MCIAVSQNSCYVFTVFLYFPYVQFILPLFSCYRNRDVVLIHPPTVAYLRWYNLRVPKIHGCSGYPPALGWWKPYYWWNWNFLIRVATTWQHGNSQLIFLWPLTPHLAIHPLIIPKGGSSGTSGGQPPDIYTSFFLRSLGNLPGVPLEIGGHVIVQDTHLLSTVVPLLP